MPDGQPRHSASGSSTRHRPVLFPIMAGATIVVLTLGLVEIGARVYVAARRGASASAPVGPVGLDSYERPDPNYAGNLLLVPGYRATVAQLLDEKRRAGKVLGVDLLRREMGELGYAPDDLAFRVNADGFRGPDLNRGHTAFRIVTVGDSCTFGGPFETYTYPRSLERRLREQGLDVEVVNAGIEGYGVLNHLSRSERLTALRPELTTIYIGWNDFWLDAVKAAERAGPGRYSEGFRLLRKAWRRIASRAGSSSGRRGLTYADGSHVDPDAAEVRAVGQYRSPRMRDVEQLIEILENSGTEVVLVTLPGLFTMSDPPSPRALELGHLPPNTQNPYLLAMLAERWNTALRKLAATRHLSLIDLDRWSRTALRPRDRYFIDSVHLTSRGQRMIGHHMAEQLVDHVRRASTASRPL